MKKKITDKFLASADYLQKIKDLKLWSQQHSPEILRPVLSYALDWLSPELLGTGFVIEKVDDQGVQAHIPCSKTNCDFQNQIHSGLVVNACFEVINTYLAQYWPKNMWEVDNYHLVISKKNKWNKDLQLVLKCVVSDIDDLILQLQKNNQITFEVNVEVFVKNNPVADLVTLQMQITKNKLLT